MRWPLGGRVQIRYNLAMALQQPEAFLRETVPHEVAHVVTKLLHPKAKPHGPEWRSLMQYLGVTEPERCHRFTLTKGIERRQRQWFYRCTCREHLLSTTRHNRVQRNRAQYRCRFCGEVLTLIQRG